MRRQPIPQASLHCFIARTVARLWRQQDSLSSGKLSLPNVIHPWMGPGRIWRNLCLETLRRTCIGMTQCFSFLTHKELPRVSNVCCHWQRILDGREGGKLWKTMVFREYKSAHDRWGTSCCCMSSALVTLNHGGDCSALSLTGFQAGGLRKMEPRSWRRVYLKAEEDWLSTPWCGSTRSELWSAHQWAYAAQRHVSSPVAHETVMLIRQVSAE